jgi:hypothetical protein
MVTIIVAVALAGVAGFFISEFARDYIATTGSIGERLLAAGKGSATIVWSRFSAVVAALAGALSGLADWLNAPGVSEAIQSCLKPEWVALYVLGLALVSEFARRRTL